MKNNVKPGESERFLERLNNNMLENHDSYCNWTFWRHREQIEQGTRSNSWMNCLNSLNVECNSTLLDSARGPVWGHYSGRRYGRVSRPQGWTYSSHLPASRSLAATPAQGTDRGSRCLHAGFPVLGQAICHVHEQLRTFLLGMPTGKALTALYRGRFSELYIYLYWRDSPGQTESLLTVCYTIVGPMDFHGSPVVTNPCFGDFLKTRNKITIWSSNPTTGHIP